MKRKEMIANLRSCVYQTNSLGQHQRKYIEKSRKNMETDVMV